MTDSLPAETKRLNVFNEQVKLLQNGENISVLSISTTTFQSYLLNNLINNIPIHIS